MMRVVRHAAAALRAAISAPRAIDRGLAPLLEAPSAGTSGASVPPIAPRDATAVVTLTRRALRLLAALPTSRWQMTCLYRGVAECLALRALGAPAVLRLGVRGAPSTPPHAAPDEARRALVAHAWVECAGLGPTPDAAMYTTLHPTATAAPRPSAD
ncbi:MAG: lasso peptide biosynthesis protein [Gemmatimonadaceae bacterium]|nr:lasso peptide biosynthesis protein [Gemmatimonadaceae bacterium]